LTSTSGRCTPGRRTPPLEPDPDIRRVRSVVCGLHVHLVFVTKYRRDVLNAEMPDASEPIMAALCAETGAELREFNGENDHVSQHLIQGHLWSPSYFAASRGGAPLSIIKEYIEQQKRPG